MHVEFDIRITWFMQSYLRLLVFLFLSIAILDFSCKPSTQPDPATKGLEQRPFVIINQGFALDTQNAEETHRILSTIENPAIIDTIYFNLINKLIFDAKYDLAINHLKKFETTLPTRNFAMQAWTNLQAGKSYYYKAVYDSADLFLKNAEKLYSKLKDTPHLAEIYNLLGTVYSYKGDFVKSTEFRYKSLNLFENLGDSTNVNLVTLELGDNYYDQEDFKKAIEVYSRALNYFTRVSDSVHMSSGHAYLASAYQQSKDIPNALIHAKEAVAIERKLKDKHGLPEALNALAITYMRNKEWSNAVPLLHETYFYIDQSDDLRELPPILHNIGVCQSELGQWDSAAYNFNKSIEVAERSGQRNGILNTYKSLYKLSRKQENYKDASQYLLTIMNLKDSLYDEEKSKTISELNVQYETEKNQQKIIELNQQKEIEQGRKQLLVGGIALISLLAFMIVLYLVSRNKKNKQLFEAQNKIQEQELNSVKRELEINKIRLQDFTQNLLSKTALIEELELKLRAGVSSHQFTDEQFHSYVEEFSKMKFMTETDWNQFRLYFDSVYPGLIQKITSTYNQITSAELRLFLLIKLSIGNKEISSMLAISPDSVKKTRYRLKKKLNLSEESSLDEFVLGFH